MGQRGIKVFVLPQTFSPQEAQCLEFQSGLKGRLMLGGGLPSNNPSLGSRLLRMVFGGFRERNCLKPVADLRGHREGETILTFPKHSF